MLNLESRRIPDLVRREWIYLPVSRVKDIGSTRASARWEIVRTDLALAEWNPVEQSAGDTGKDRIFQPRYSRTKTSRWSPGYLMALSSQERLRIEAMTSVGMVELLCSRDRSSIMPQRRSQRSPRYFQACLSSDTNAEMISATRTPSVSSR